MTSCKTFDLLQRSSRTSLDDENKLVSSNVHQHPIHLSVDWTRRQLFARHCFRDWQGISSYKQYISAPKAQPHVMTRNASSYDIGYVSACIWKNINTIETLFTHWNKIGNQLRTRLRFQTCTRDRQINIETKRHKSDQWRRQERFFLI